MIRKLKVSGLNDQFDYEFEFNEDLNIFTGANGCGKTALLKLIWYLISGNLHRIPDEIPFKLVSIETDQFSLSLERFKPKSTSGHGVDGERKRGGRGGNTKPKIRIDWKPRGKKETEFNVNVSGFQTKFPVINLDQQIVSLGLNSLFFPTFRRIEGGFSINPGRSTVHTENVIEEGLQTSTAEMLQTAMSRLSEELSTNRHKFITAVSMKDIEELLPIKKGEIAGEVNKLYAELSRRIGEEVASPEILQSNGDQAISALEHIQEDLLETAKTRQRLENRMTVLDETAQIILEYKEIQIAKGITLGKKKEIGSKKAAIHADKLSSGEKQMLGFLCYNAFSDNTAIFIDEPELSLHQDWQDILLPLLLKQETGNQFFVATHSEFIYEQFPDNEHILNLEGN